MLHKSIALLFAGLLMVGISGCEKEEGPIEKAGKSLDQAATSVKESADQAATSVKESADQAETSVQESYEEAKDVVLDKGPAEKAGESIDDAVKSISE